MYVFMGKECKMCVVLMSDSRMSFFCLYNDIVFNFIFSFLMSAYLSGDEGSILYTQSTYASKWSHNYELSTYLLTS